ncbi:MAG TPA: hypothetical protein VNJ08_17155 [Bacteriovoracaceae bacterium]|nr:hypothetical protein [Bacteriovoracaceae bacterium]
MNKFLILTSLLMISLVSVASAQTVSTTQLSQHSFTKWKENFKVSYFGELLGSNLEKWDDNQYNDLGEKQRTPTNLYNQFGLQYKVLPTTSLLLSPRFLYQIGDRNDLKPEEDQNSVMMEDWLIGVVQEIYKSKEVTFNGRLSHRHPFSKASRNELIDSQIEYQNSITWLATQGITLVHQNTYRYYAYEAARNEDRYRINFTTVLNYDFNDKWKTQLFNEWDLQHRATKNGGKDVNKQDWNYFEKYKNHVALGVGYAPTKTLTVMPFVKALNDENWSAETTQMGLWVFGKIL